MKTNPVSDFSKNLSIINELAFSIGNSLNLQENCDAFCRLLLARKNYSFVSIWLKNDLLENRGRAGEATCVYAYPLVMADVVTLPVGHPLFALLTHGRAISYSSQDAEFALLIAEKRILGGVYALYPLGDYGVLKIYVQNRDDAFSAEELAQLRNVIKKFAVSVRGCISHQSLVDEICERTLAETRLENSKNAMESFIDSIPEPAGMVGTDQSVIVGNAAFFRIHGFFGDGTSDTEVPEWHSAAVKGMMDGFARVLEEKKPVINEIAMRNYVFEIHLTPVIDSTGEMNAIAFFTVDITDKKKEMLEQLRKSEQQFRELADFIPIMLYECDVAGTATFANRTAFSSMKMTPEMLDSGIHFSNCVIPEEVSRANYSPAEIESNCRKQGMQFTIKRTDGTTFPALIYSSTIMRDGKYCGIRGAVVDITEQVRAEEALRKINLKLALLTSVTRHDILNQVTAMLLYKELLTDTIAAKEPVDAEYVSGLFDIAETIERQILFSRDYQEIGMEAPRWEHVCAVVRKVSQCTELSALDVTCNAGDLEIYADHLFEKVVFNLMENCLRHGVDGSSMEVTWVPDSDGGITLLFADDGVGVPDGKKELIFEKGFGSNTGYGLYLIREILWLTGITIEETGTVGKGATFSLTIPSGACRNYSDSE